MATDQNDRLLRALLDEMRALHSTVQRLTPPTVTVDPGTVELREPAATPTPEATGDEPASKKTTARRAKK